MDWAAAGYTFWVLTVALAALGVVVIFWAGIIAPLVAFGYWFWKRVRGIE